MASHLGKKRLLIVADGARQYLPFAALPIPQDEGRTTPAESKSNFTHPSSLRLHPYALIPPSLIVEHEIVSLPSASVIAVLRREMAGRQPAAKAVAVLADPVFNDDDARVTLSRTSRKSPAVAQHQTEETTLSASPSFDGA
ncbi:MAG: hypothetical protein WKF84_24525 [Pyrinomonadaceae bacterium]